MGRAGAPISQVASQFGAHSQVQTTPPTPPAQVLYSTDVINQYTQVGGVSRAPPAA